jgi:hypothetical protein
MDDTDDDWDDLEGGIDIDEKECVDHAWRIPWSSYYNKWNRTGMQPPRPYPGKTQFRLEFNA